MEFKISFVESLKKAIEIVKLNGKVAKNVSKDKNATLNGVLIIAILGFISHILSFNINNIITTLAIIILGYLSYKDYRKEISQQKNL